LMVGTKAGPSADASYLHSAGTDVMSVPGQGDY